MIIVVFAGMADALSLAGDCSNHNLGRREDMREFVLPGMAIGDGPDHTAAHDADCRIGSRPHLMDRGLPPVSLTP